VLEKTSWAVLFAVALAGCASQKNDADFPANDLNLPGAEPAAEHDAPVRATSTGVLARDQVNATVDKGLGYFLQRVEVEPSLDNGRFKGFRIVTLRPPEWWRGIDLGPGDVVVSVNGMPIERETEAYDAFVALKKAKELRVKYLRAGRERELVYRIVDAPAKKQPG
jgi:S1-C subfamily serine protease